jgi:molybdopterin converting factor small subunit
MSIVTCCFLGSLRQAAGGQREETVEIDGEPTLSNLLRILTQRYGEAFAKRMIAEGGQLSPSVLVSISGQSEHTTTRQLDTVIHDGDKVTFLNALAGGTSATRSALLPVA